MENGKHYITWPQYGPFQPQTNIVYKISKSNLRCSKKKKSGLIFCIRLDDYYFGSRDFA